MSSYLEAIELNLPQQSVRGQIRHKVLASTLWSPTPTTNVSYVSSVSVLIVASQAQAQAIAERLEAKMVCYFAMPAAQSAASALANGWQVNAVTLQGYLGRFTASLGDMQVAADSAACNLGLLLGIGNGLFDQVIDCGESPLISAAVKPPGYYHVAADSVLLEAAIAQIPSMIGEFDKPKYFDYNPDICAHGRSGITGCTRCLDACPTDAIISIGEQVKVNPHLCQGGGSCASSCPSGAIRYRYPNVEAQIELVRSIIAKLRAAMGDAAMDCIGITILIYDNEHGAAQLRDHLHSIPEHVVPIAVEEIGSAGLDLIATAMAYGATRVFIYAPDTCSQSVGLCLRRDVVFMETVFAGLAIDGYQIRLISDLQDLADSAPATAVSNVATYSGLGNKRSIIRNAMDFFHRIAPQPQASIALPAGSIFGALDFNHDACTLCMGCVSVCPAGALEAGGDTPALKFIEANCLQCGICTKACPESALSLHPRFNFDLVSANKKAVLKQAQPFRCITCNKPFATYAMINKMTEKLQGHWMFETPEAVNRLKMCADCRVANMFDSSDMIGD